MTSTVAVAGGTGGLGRAIVEALATEGKFNVLVLSRKWQPDHSSPKKEKLSGTRTIGVDYNDLNDLTRVFEENNVSTVVSVLNIQVDATPELNLIKAAEGSRTTQRFIPSIWGVKYTKRQMETHQVAKAKLEVLSLLDQSSLEYSAWYVGCFLDYWVMPHAISYMPPFPYAIDIESHRAALPGSGDVPAVFNYTLDIAKFVAASLSVTKWEKETYVAGDRVTWNDFLAIVEDVTGVKFEVSYDPIELLQTGKTNALPAVLPSNLFVPREILEGYMANLGIMFEAGQFDLRPSHTINEAFPDIKVRKVREFITEVWGKK